ncbi:MAG TPA: ABC transporter permease [Roseiflexaceae bacterium]|nr:ABC transporter permease [Roseiflexaceae bacterium]
MRYILRRIGFYAVAAWVSITINFFLPRLMPGDPASAIFARFQGQMSPEAMEALRKAFGLTDEPLIKQYITYLSHALRGDLGISIAYFPAPVTSVIATGLLWTLLLAGTATIISFGLGSLLGVVAAWRRGGRLDTALPPFLMFVYSFPYFWLAMLALFFLSFRLGWFPLRHAYSDALAPAWSAEFVGSVLYHLMLPVITIVVVSLGNWLLGMRNSMIGVLAEDHIALAEAKGLPQRQVMYRYAARNALLPNITAFGMALGFILGGALLTEIVFSYPGMGYLLVQSVRNQDYPLMQGLFLMITLAVLAANLLVDLLYVRLDPRVRSRG